MTQLNWGLQNVVPRASCSLGTALVALMQDMAKRPCMCSEKKRGLGCSERKEELEGVRKREEVGKQQLKQLHVPVSVLLRNLSFS